MKPTRADRWLLRRTPNGGGRSLFWHLEIAPQRCPLRVAIGSGNVVALGLAPVAPKRILPRIELLNLGLADVARQPPNGILENPPRKPAAVGDHEPQARGGDREALEQRPGSLRGPPPRAGNGKFRARGLNDDPVNWSARIRGQQPNVVIRVALNVDPLDLIERASIGRDRLRVRRGPRPSEVTQGKDPPGLQRRFPSPQVRSRPWALQKSRVSR